MNPESPPGWASAPTRRGSSIATLVGSLVGVAGLVAVALGLDADFGAALSLLRELDPVLLLLAVPIGILSKGMVGAAWRAVLGSLGSRPPLPAVLRWYYLGSMGKYLPGGVWPVVGRGELAASGGVPRGIAYPSVALSMMLTFMGAALTTLLALPWAIGEALEATRGSEVLGTAAWSLLVLPVGVALLHPAVGGRALRWGMVRAGRGRTNDDDAPAEGVRIPDGRAIAGLTLAHVPIWILVGVTQLWVTALVAQAAGVALPGAATVVAATSLAWLGGFLALPVPSGIGVREAIYVAALPALPPDVALGAALVCRLVFVAGDALAAAGALLLGGSRSE